MPSFMPIGDVLAVDQTFAFNTLNLKNIYPDTMGSNLKIQKVLQNFGFELLNTDTLFYYGRPESRQVELSPLQPTEVK